MDDVFRALADPHRRQLLDRLNARNGQTLRELGTDLAMTRQAVSKHLAILESALLVTTVRQGREKLHYLNPLPIHEIADRWIHRYDRARVEALTDLKHALEDTDMTPARSDRPEFVYTTYIRTTPERLFAALTEPAFTRRYWDLAFDTDWSVGRRHGLAAARHASIVDPEQVVLECDPPRRLSYTWHTFTEEWAVAVGIAPDERARIADEPRSKVTFELERRRSTREARGVHDGFAPGSEVLQKVSGGWPKILGVLKTMLETGDLETGWEPSAVAAAPAAAVHEALTTLDGLGAWWMPDVEGDPAHVRGRVTFRFDGDHVTMRVDHLEPTLVVWTCTESTKFAEWIDTTLWWDLQQRDDARTDIEFHQVGVSPTCECFDECTRGWNHFVVSLAEFAAGSGGYPRGSAEWEAARASA